MSKISEDKAVVEFEAEFRQAAIEAKNWVIARATYVKKDSHQQYVYSSNHPNPVGEARGDYLQNRAGNLFRGRTDEERQELSGHLLWFCKEFLTHPIAPYARAVVTDLVENQPLDAQNKIHFLEYLFSKRYPRKQHKKNEFTRDFYCKLASYDPSQNMAATNRLYYKALKCFEAEGHRKHPDAELVFDMFKVFVNNVESIEPAAVVNYAELYFALQRHSDKELEFDPVVQLCSKTPWRRDMRAACGDCCCLDKEVMRDVFKKYAEISLASKDVDTAMNWKMTETAKNIVDTYNYTREEALHLAEVVLPPERDANGKNIPDNKRRTAMRQMSNEVRQHAETSLEWKSRTLENLDIRHLAEPIEPEQIVDYAKQLFEDAAQHSGVEVNVDVIYTLLKTSGAIDKQTLNEVVSAYGESVSPQALDHSFYNVSLNDNMQKMLGHIVETEEYSEEEMSRLAHAISKGGKGHEEFERMAEIIQNIRAVMGDYHMPNIKSKPPLKIDRDGR